MEFYIISLINVFKIHYNNLRLLFERFANYCWLFRSTNLTLIVVPRGVGAGSYVCRFVTSKPWIPFKNAFGWSAAVSREDEPVLLCVCVCVCVWVCGVCVCGVCVCECVVCVCVFYFVTTMHIFQSMLVTNWTPNNSDHWNVTDTCFLTGSIRFFLLCFPRENWHRFIRCQCQRSTPE